MSTRFSSSSRSQARPETSSASSAAAAPLPDTGGEGPTGVVGVTGASGLVSSPVPVVVAHAVALGPEAFSDASIAMTW